MLKTAFAASLAAIAIANEPNLISTVKDDDKIEIRQLNG